TGKKDDLMNHYALLRCEPEAVTEAMKKKFISSKEQFGQIIGLVKKEDVVKKKGVKVLAPSIEDIMQYSEGDEHEKLTL
ncbi:MAG: hypothetical protein MJ213_06000, partial [Bacilli bacterium]|nr:hypothetical protein [Bacilli bacterium]